MGRKVKTSIYIDEELWRILKESAASMGIETSELLERLIVEGLDVGLLRALEEVENIQEVPLDIEPLDLGVDVSPIIRELRDGRANRLLGQ
ncbi:MAG: DNA-binding protein [Thermoproteus sp.]